MKFVAKLVVCAKDHLLFHFGDRNALVEFRGDFGAFHLPPGVDCEFSIAPVAVDEESAAVAGTIVPDDPEVAKQAA